MCFIENLNSFVIAPALLVSIFGVGVLLCFRLRFFHLRHPIRILRILLRKNSSGTSPFRALSVALAGTLGVGNIAGVASALSCGGPGALFWMWVGAVISMPIKYGEILLAMLFRRKDECGRYVGGAFYYICDGLKSPRVAAFFALLTILTSFTLGNAVQVKAASDAAEKLCEAVGVEGLRIDIILPILLAVLTGLAVFGGFSRISDVTVKLIPLLSAAYIAVSMFIILRNVEILPSIFADVLRSAFGVRQAVGGVVGYSVTSALRYGISRGILSNEAGCGTAPTAHATSDEVNPAYQACFGIFEVFADTILLCSMTAAVVLIYGCEFGNGISLALDAYTSGAGAFAGIFLSVSVICFAYATLVCWSYYGIEAVRFLSKSDRLRKVYLVVYCGIVAFGGIIENGIIWQSADITVGLMTVVNCVCLLLMSGTVVRETKKGLRWF